LLAAQVTESHQSSKKDTSGTAKAIVNSFQGLGLDFDVSQVRQHMQAVGLLVKQRPLAHQAAAFCSHGSTRPSTTLGSQLGTDSSSFQAAECRCDELLQRKKCLGANTTRLLIPRIHCLLPLPCVQQIELVRDREQQLGRMRVPEDALLGHAFHTYQLISPDGSVSFEFQHNVCGRTIYAEGTVDAALFLARQVQQGASQKLYNMVDVLKAGAMR
jgi:hypothetical protein